MSRKWLGIILVFVLWEGVCSWIRPTCGNCTVLGTQLTAEQTPLENDLNICDLGQGVLQQHPFFGSITTPLEE